MAVWPRKTRASTISASAAAFAFSGSLRGERASELAERLLVTLVRDLSKVARELQAHPLTRRDLPTLLGVQPFEEVVHRHAQHVGDLEQPPRRDAIDAALVFVRL